MGAVGRVVSVFFFSSRRRHTRCSRDWSSDVCSSDLILSSPMIPEIAFGTDGWRGVIAEDFTFANARVVTHAIARYVVLGEDARRGVIVGYDHRYASDRVAAAVAEVICASGTPVWLADKPFPTPTIFFLVRHRQAGRGIVRTARHNPYRSNRIQYKATYGTTPPPSIVSPI